MPDERKRVLVVDDDAAVRALFRVALEGAGFAVEEGEDGADGLAKAQSFKPHLIVLDLMMPKLNGTEVLHRLQDLGLDSIPVVIVTAYGRAVSEEILRREPNVVEFLEKPLRFAEIPARLKGFIERSARR